MSKLDHTDLQILELLQRDATLSSAQVAEAIGKSQSLVWRRIVSLETSGAIKRRVTVVDRETVGLGLLVHVLIVLNNQTQGSVSAFQDAVAGMPEIIQCHMLMGDIDFLLLAVTRDLASYRVLLRERLSTLPGVRGIDSRVVVEDVKSTTELPLRTLIHRQDSADGVLEER
jgi:Lrp/AsnC family transcriptional regulator